jgi:integrase
MSSYLARRGGIWWVRLVVPVRLRDAVGRREFIQSSRTHELPIAKLVASVLLVGWRQQLLKLDSHTMSSDVLKLVDASPILSGTGWVSLGEAASLSGISQDQLLRAVEKGKLGLFSRLFQVSGYVLAMDALDLNDPSAGRAGGVVIPQSSVMPSHALETTQNGALRLSDSVGVASVILACSLQSVEIVSFDVPGQPGMLFAPDMNVNVAVEKLEVLAAEVEVIRQRLAQGITADAIQRAQELQKVSLTGGIAHSAGRKAHKLFSEALAEFAKHELPQNNRNPKEIERIRAGISLFADLVGDLKLSKIDSDVLREFRDGPLAKVPAKLNHAEVHFKTSGQGVKATMAAILSSGETWPVMSSAERDQRMTWLGRMFRWLQGDWLREDPSAALRGKSVSTKAERILETRSKVPRQPFTKDELKLIFSQSWFETGDGQVAEEAGINRKWSPFEFWLPLMCLHAGQRIRELCQLHLSDVKQSSKGVWYLSINDATSDKSLKNGDSKRVVPLHPVLIQAGFVEWCERLRLEGFKRVFPELSWEPVSGYSKEAKRRMSSMLSGLGMPRDNTKVFHSLRHTANNAFIRLGLAGQVPEMVRLRLLGHKAGDGENIESYFTDFDADENINFVALLNFNLPTIAKFNADQGIKAIRAALKRKHGARRDLEDMGRLS